MEEARLNITHKRPTLVLDKRFNIDLELGEKVQLEASIEVARMSLSPDGDGNEQRVIEFLVHKANKATGKLL